MGKTSVLWNIREPVFHVLVLEVVHLLSTEVLYAPWASLSPWWYMVFNSFKYVFLDALYIKQP